MLQVQIPGGETLRLEHLVLDFNGTLARDGILLEGVRDRIVDLARQMRVHVVTADTFGRAREELDGMPCNLVVLESGGQTAAKSAYVEQLGGNVTACVGNGRNDRSMMERAALAVAVVQEEGAAPETLLAATIVSRDVCDALDLLLHPLRLTATLRR